MEYEEDRAKCKGFLRPMSAAASQNKRLGRKSKDRAICLETTGKLEHSTT
jgi:hypothetical protein